MLYGHKKSHNTHIVTVYYIIRMNVWMNLYVYKYLCIYMQYYADSSLTEIPHVPNTCAIM